MKATELGNPANWGDQITQAWRVILTIHLQHADEIDSAGDNLEVESNSQANQLLKFCLQRCLFFFFPLTLYFLVTIVNIS